MSRRSARLLLVCIRCQMFRVRCVKLHLVYSPPIAVRQQTIESGPHWLSISTKAKQRQDYASMGLFRMCAATKVYNSHLLNLAQHRPLVKPPSLQRTQCQCDMQAFTHILLDWILSISMPQCSDVPFASECRGPTSSPSTLFNDFLCTFVGFVAIRTRRPGHVVEIVVCSFDG